MTTCNVCNRRTADNPTDPCNTCTAEIAQGWRAFDQQRSGLPIVQARIEGLLDFFKAALAGLPKEREAFFNDAKNASGIPALAIYPLALHHAEKSYETLRISAEVLVLHLEKIVDDCKNGGR